MENRKGLAKTIAKLLQGYATPEATDKVIALIKNHALAAGAAAGAAEVVNGGVLLAMAAATGFVWSLYYRICKELGINLSKNKLKAIASVIAADLGAALAATLTVNAVLNAIPILNLAGAAMGALSYFALVYASGVLFIMVLIRVFKVSGSFAGMDSISEEDLVKVAKTTVKAEGKKVGKQAMKEYNEVKNDPTLNPDSVEVLED